MSDLRTALDGPELTDEQIDAEIAAFRKEREDAPEWLKRHADGPGHHYSLDDCRAALRSTAPKAGTLDGSMVVEHVATGWVAHSNGLASRGATREEAVKRQEELVALVRRLADMWEAKPDRAAVLALEEALG